MTTMDISVAKGTVVEKTLQLSADQELHINVENGAHLQLLIEGSCQQLITEIHVSEAASLDFCDLDTNETNTNRSHKLHISQDTNSQVFVNSISLSAGNTQNTTHVELCGEGAELTLNGMVIASGTQKIENHTLIQHIVPHTTSHQLYKYILDEQATGTYAGLVKVLPGAHHTMSEQTNRNLCVTREAHMFSQPQLEIYNDDVRCSHGSSTGQLDEGALFYMQQRGISKHEARLLLMAAFMSEVVEQVRIPALRERLQEMVEKRFRSKSL